MSKQGAAKKQRAASVDCGAFGTEQMQKRRLVNHPTAKTRRRVKAMEFASSLAGWSPENDG